MTRPSPGALWQPLACRAPRRAGALTRSRQHWVELGGTAARLCVRLVLKPLTKWDAAEQGGMAEAELANRRLQPLGHVSGDGTSVSATPSTVKDLDGRPGGVHPAT